MAVKRAELISKIETRLHDPQVIAVMSRVPRHEFVPEDKVDMAYEDIPLLIGSGQTISQPYIVALMTSSLKLNGTEKVLEVGTGSGYQAAVLGELAKTVITVERLPDMAEKAARTLARLGYNNIFVKTAGDDLGWKQEAPYDAILVAAAAPDVPEVLIEQLADNGRMIIPAGDRSQQELLLLQKIDGEIETRRLGSCRFVSLIGKDAWNER